MRKAFLIIFLFFLNSFSSSSQSIRDNISYDFSCMEDDIFSAFVNLSSDLENEMINSIGDDVSISEEIKYGDSSFIEINKEYTIISEGIEYTKIQEILQRISAKINSPKGFKYIAYLIESKEINAFTIGGNIYITTAMVTFCMSNDEIACIIGHEIAHNELGHIRNGISRVKTARRFGVFGDLNASFLSLVTVSFNQKNEIHSDFIGMDLAIAAGYDGCASSRLWSRMKSKEDSSGGIDTLFSTHPYSAKREACSRQHLEVNYSKNCE
jgi:predicted Zn-dependent protease